MNSPRRDKSLVVGMEGAVSNMNGILGPIPIFLDIWRTQDVTAGERVLWDLAQTAKACRMANEATGPADRPVESVHIVEVQLRHD
jgi:hypothetical protein